MVTWNAKFKYSLLKTNGNKITPHHTPEVAILSWGFLIHERFRSNIQKQSWLTSSPLQMGLCAIITAWPSLSCK